MNQKPTTCLKISRRSATIAVYKSTSFTNKAFDLIVSHVAATKHQAVNRVKELLKIQTKKTIGVGDAHNDVPLLMACGLKVAMGNAVEELKNIADYVAPDVGKDGVANIIEKFIIPTEHDAK